MEAWLAWAKGPAFVFALSFMVLGLIRHVVITVLETRRIMRRAGDKSLPSAQIWRATVRWLVPVGKIRDQFVFSATSMIFHVAILIVPLFLAGHIALWRGYLGFGLPAISNDVADILTIVAVVTAVALVIQRLAARDTRAISRVQDYVLPLLVALPFATGFLVMHPGLNPFAFEPTLFVHVMSANLVFVLMPLTKLSHAVLLPSVQLVSEAGWHWPADSGTRVGIALGKEGEPI